jgi:hypothetical protein
MRGKKILMLVGEFNEEYGIFVFEQTMHAVGHTLHVVCPDKEAGEAIFMREWLKVLGTDVKHGEMMMREASLAA